MYKGDLVKKVKLRDCLTKTMLVDFDEKVKAFKRFYRVSQFVYPQPKNIKGAEGHLMEEPLLLSGEFLYGVNENGDLTWLADIIDSGG
jgi:hypothetical protein